MRVGRVDVGNTDSSDNSRWILAFVCIVCFAVVVGFSGWRSGFVSFDLVTPIDEATALLHTGHLPEKGCLSSLASFTPPGVSYALVPGLLTGSPFLYERVGAAVLFMICLLGIYLLANECAGPKAALFSTSLFAFSDLGLFWSSSLWPRGHVVFYVWIAWLTMRWVSRRSTWCLGTLIAVYATGMYLHMEMAFAILPVPLIWLIYRPPIGPSWVAAGVLYSVLVWAPYLRFESGRDFVDLRSQLGRRDLPVPSLAEKFSGQIEAFDQGSGRWTTLGEPSEPDQARSQEIVAPHSLGTRIMNRVGLSVQAIFSNFRESRVLLFVAGPLVLLVPALWLLSRRDWLRRVPILSRTAVCFDRRQDQMTVLLVSLTVPWLAMIEADPNTPYRYWGLWGLQAVAAGAGIMLLVRGLSISEKMESMLMIGVALACAFDSPVPSRLSDCLRHGFGGDRSPGARICDALAVEAKATSAPARIGYRLNFAEFQLTYHALDPRYKIGGDFDRYLSGEHQIQNATASAQGFSEEDDFRIVQTSVPVETFKYRFKASLPANFVLVASDGPFELWKRKSAI